MVTREQYDAAVQQKSDAERVIQEFHRQKQAAFDQRMKENPIFHDGELRYSRDSLCLCGHGLAYPIDCGPFHYWDCSAILKGIDDKSVKHCPQMPFTTYEIKAENEERTTRGVFRPKAIADAGQQ